MNINTLIFIIVMFFTKAVSANVGVQYDYFIPHNKTNVAICQKEALKIYHGAIDELHGKKLNGIFYFQIKINRTNDVDKLVLCDLEQGKILDNIDFIGK